MTKDVLNRNSLCSFQIFIERNFCLFVFNINIVCILLNTGLNNDFMIISFWKPAIEVGPLVGDQ